MASLSVLAALRHRVDARAAPTSPQRMLVGLVAIFLVAAWTVPAVAFEAAAAPVKRSP